MSYAPSTTLLVLSGGQSTADSGALIAAAAGFLGTVIGAAVAVLGTRISAKAEDRRQERRLAAEQLNLQEAHRDNLERQVREAAIGLSDAWASVIQSHDRYRRMAAMSENEAYEARTKMVEALTRTGSQLNALLVLPISKQLEARVFAVDKVVDSFRGSLNDFHEAVKHRNAVAPEILELFSALRKGDLLRIDKTVPGAEE